ncbi:Unannotated [Lentimonas sp. CC4]|nr:Unannotated [Lentimonas sp. CC4]CAA6686118.1 Unannotated [Lentimonas sp. CC6]CAA7074150.1 Unannotated [Lentimonas sp. CC4]CAA7171508.1 Unannotated [Lentimonas sp. CC21]CAA7181986.1 Unannotated [Lentimonas sp. CC8]
MTSTLVTSKWLISERSVFTFPHFQRLDHINRKHNDMTTFPSFDHISILYRRGLEVPYLASKSKKYRTHFT